MCENKLNSKPYRRKIYKKTNNRCGYCGKKMNLSDKTHIDHIIPRSKGGKTKFENLILACPSCNLSKKDKSVKDFKEYMKDFTIDALYEYTENYKHVESKIRIHNCLPQELRERIDIATNRIANMVSDYQIIFYMEKSNDE